jgi:hypothetical protein
VIDFGPLASAQRGKIDLSGDTGWFHADAHLTRPVDVTKALVFHSQTCNGTGDLYPRPFATAEFTSEDNLRIERQYPGQQSHIEWQVLELPPATFFAQEPNIQLFPTSLAFPTTAVGGDADLTFDIRNTGAADLHVDSLEFVGLDKAVYSLAPSVTPAQAGVQESRSAGLRFPLPSPQRRCASGRR